MSYTKFNKWSELTSLQSDRTSALSLVSGTRSSGSPKQTKGRQPQLNEEGFSDDRPPPLPPYDDIFFSVKIKYMEDHRSYARKMSS